MSLKLSLCIVFFLGSCAVSASESSNSSALNPPGQRAAVQTSVARQDRTADAIDALLQRALRKRPLAGVSVSIERDNEIIFERGYGYANIKEGIPASATTVYRIGSVTKQFTAVAILQLAESKKISLDAPITDILPNYPMQGKTISVRHLLGHTSGVKSYTELESWKASDTVNKTTDEMIALFKDLPLDFDPGDVFSYSNSGYFLLGAIIEKVSGMTYQSYLQANVFGPAELLSTSYCDEEEFGQGIARGYKRSGGQLSPADSLSMTQPFSAGALCSTTQDLVRWRRALNQKVLLNAESSRLLETSGSLRDGSETGYGFGFFVGTLGQHTRVFHGGSINGFSAQVAYYPSDGLSVVILSNTEGAGVSSLEEEIVRKVLDIPELKLLRLALPTQEMNQYVGDYSHSALGKLSVTIVDGILHSKLASQPAMPLLYQGNSEFVPDLSVLGAKIDPTIRVRFQPGSVFITQHGMTVQLKRTGED